MRAYEKIKRRNGEAFAKAIKNYDNGIFDIPEIDHILRYAGNSAQDAESLLSYLSSLKDVKIMPVKKPENPFVLLKRAGYDAFVADTKTLKNSIKKYFAPDEAICTFNDDDRHNNYYIIHCVHERAGSLRREDFKTPRREDDYGTSVISIQIARRGGFIKITNRYNHKVNNCDNTFNSNPDNIIDGLSAAIKDHFKVDFSSQKSPVPDDWRLVGKKVCKIEQECDGMFFGFDFYVKNGELIEVKAGDGQYLIESYLYDDRAKKMTKLTGDGWKDSFPDDFNKYYGDKKSLSWRGKSLFDGGLEILKCA